MATLLAGQLELEEAFMEVENDEEFVGKEGRPLRTLLLPLPAALIIDLDLSRG